MSDDLLDDGFRSRLAAALADAIGRVDADVVPARLKKVVAFAPAKRARLGGRQIVEAADVDSDLRSALAAQLGSDHSEEAVLAWLERGDGWAEAVRRASAAGRDQKHAEAARAAAQRADRARERQEAAVEELRDVRRRSRADLDAAKADNADLRRRLGEARQQVRRSAEEADEARREAKEAVTAAERQRGSVEAEARRLRQRIADLEDRLARTQGSDRTDREQATMRARLLLDTVLEATSGLRRELGLPASTRAPADGVAADLPGASHRATSAAGSLADDDPALLDQLCALPRVHVIVDGYNVTKSARPDATLETQRQWLAQAVAGLVARTRAEVTVVFDAAEVTGDRPSVAQPRGVRVRFSGPGQIADDLIREYVAAEPAGRPVVVVTSDRAVADDVVRRAGTHAVPSAALVRLLGR